MNVLVVNIGSTSFKFRLLDMRSEQALARGYVEGVGKTTSTITLALGDKPPRVAQQPVADQAAAVRLCLHALGATGDDAKQSRYRIDAVGFKAVHGGQLPEAVRITPDVLRVIEEFTDAAPAHNPAYLAAMRAFAEQMPQLPLVAAFETGFHRSIPATRTTFAIPYEWTQRFGVKRYGFHGASHRYIATRAAELLERRDLRIISCHLGGSSSISAIRGDCSVANSFGMTPQSGVPHNNRVGEFDAYALHTLRARTGQNFDELLATMASKGGLLGISGLSNEMPELLAAAATGNERAELAVGVFVEGVRHYLGAFLVALGGLDALVFTGGIGERSAEIRRRVCAGLEFLGVRLDASRNNSAAGEATVSPEGAGIRVMTIPTNEELIVARQTVAALQAN